MSKRNTHEKEIHLRDYIQPILRRKWILIISFTVFFLTVVIISFNTNPVYKATTQVMIDIENPKVIPFEDIMSLSSPLKLFYQTQCRILSSRSLALRVINALNLKDSPEFKSDNKTFNLKGVLSLLVGKIYTKKDFQDFDGYEASNSKGRNESKSDERENTSGIKDRLDLVAGRLYTERESNNSDLEDENTKLIDSYLERLKVEPIVLSNLVNISFRGVNPEIITKIVNKHVEEYIAQTLEARSTESQYAVKLLQKQLYEKKDMVEKAENALQLYKEREKIVSIEERQNIVVQKLEELNTALTDARTERMGMETLNNLAMKYSQIPEKVESIPEVIKNPLIQDLKKKYVDLSTEITRLSDKYGRNHPEMIRIASKADELQDKIKVEVGKIIKSIEADYNMALKKEENLAEALEEQKEKALELNRKAITYGTLKREVETERAMYSILLKRMKETDITRALMISNINIVDPAEVPKYPIKPMKVLNLIIGVIVGLGLGIGVIFFLEHFDDTIKSPEDIERYLGLSLLGAFEKVKMVNDMNNSSYDIITHKVPRSNIAEAFRITRTNIMFPSVENRTKSRKLMLITSTSENEGKTFVASNLAVVVAQTGKKTLIVDTDFRNPRLNKVFRTKMTPGLSDHLVGKKGLEAIIKSTRVPNLSIITCGRIPHNPSELLGSDKMEVFCRDVRERFDIVFFDAPPSMIVTDAVVLSNMLDGVIFVVKYGEHVREAVERALSQITDKGHEVMGVVMNYIDVCSGGYYRLYPASYRYGYYSVNGNVSEKSNKAVKTI